MTIKRRLVRLKISKCTKAYKHIKIYIILKWETDFTLLPKMHFLLYMAL